MCDYVRQANITTKPGLEFYIHQVLHSWIPKAEELKRIPMTK